MMRLISCQGEKFRTLFATDGNLTVHCKKLENAPYPGQMYVQHVRKNSLTSRKSCGIFIETITSVYFRFAACTFENIRSSKVFIYGRNDKKRRLKYRRRWSLKPKNAEAFFFYRRHSRFLCIARNRSVLISSLLDVCRRRVYISFR